MQTGVENRDVNLRRKCHQSSKRPLSPLGGQNIYSGLRLQSQPLGQHLLPSGPEALSHLFFTCLPVRPCPSPALVHQQPHQHTSQYLSHAAPGGSSVFVLLFPPSALAPNPFRCHPDTSCWRAHHALSWKPTQRVFLSSIEAGLQSAGLLEYKLSIN